MDGLVELLAAAHDAAPLWVQCLVGGAVALLLLATLVALRAGPGAGVAVGVLGTGALASAHGAQE